MIYIPTIGDRLKIQQDWQFKLYWERRNEKFFRSLLEIKGGDVIVNIYHRDEELYYQPGWKSTTKLPEEVLQNKRGSYLDVTIPKESILKLDRIYIRQGSENFDSVSFYWNSNKPKYRFWATRFDVNSIEGNWIKE